MQLKEFVTFDDDFNMFSIREKARSDEARRIFENFKNSLNEFQTEAKTAYRGGRKYSPVLSVPSEIDEAVLRQLQEELHDRFPGQLECRYYEGSPIGDPKETWYTMSRIGEVSRGFRIRFC